MAMVKCGECGNDISSDAKACPKCGWRPSRGTGRRVLKWVLVAIVAAPMVVVAGAWVRNKAIGPEGWLREGAEKTIRASLIDPASFVLRESYIVRRPAEKGGVDIALCGVFDGRNRMGAYTGGSRFVALGFSTENTFSMINVKTEEPEQKRTAEQVGMLSPFESAYWNGNCVDDAHPALVAAKK